MAERTLGILVKAEGAAQAAGLIGQVDKSVQRLGSHTGIVGRFGSAMKTAGSRIGGLVSAIGPVLGVAGVAGLGAAFASSLTKATEFGETVAKLAPLLNLPTEAASGLVDTIDKFGITGDKQVVLLGRLEKNAGALAVTQDKAAKFEKQFGFNLLGANGQIADANVLLQRSADFFNSNASATDKAQVLTKLYGRTWADLIPVLKLGSEGIKAEEKSAIHLTDSQLANMEKFKQAQRNFGDAIGDLQVKIGAEFMPMITSALQEVSTWLDSHSDEVVAFFKGAADFGAQLAAGARTAFGAIKAGWDLIPGPLKTLLIEGLVAGKVTKFLFDFGPMDFAKLGTKLFGGVAGGLLARGGTPANPVFVSDVTGGLGGAASGGGLLRTALGLGAGGLGGLFIAGIAPIVLSQLAIAVAGGPEGVAARDLAGRQATAAARGIPGQVPNRPAAGPINVAGDWFARQAAANAIPASQRNPDRLDRASGVRSLLGDSDVRKNLAMQAILQRALAKGFRPSQAAVTATYERDVARSTALTARRSEELKTAVQNNAVTIVAGISAAIRNLPQSITTINVTASDVQRVRVQRMNAVKPHGSRNSRIGGPTQFD